MSMKSSIAAVSLLALLGTAGVAGAETLLIQRVQAESTAAQPQRGQSMAQVEARFGAADQRLEPRGGQKRQWPTINRWVYPTFVVYFENDKVIDVVAHQSSPNELGPKPPIR